jgi:hypothetical protein
MTGDPFWWSLRDIELELGRPVAEAPALLALREVRRDVEALEARMRLLATTVERLDLEAQEAIIERGEHPREWWFDGELPGIEPAPTIPAPNSVT